MPSLTALRAFEAAARNLSFRDAAEELHVTHSAVSHQIKDLERELGTSLFWRRGRRVELTEVGALYYPVLRDTFDRIAEGAELVRRATRPNTLTVQVYVTVAVRWLIPRLHDFQEANRDLLAYLSTSYLDWEFDAEHVDVGFVCASEPHRAAWHYTPLFRALMFPVCSPALVQGGLGLRQPSDLVNHALLQVYTAADDWSAWLEAAGVPQLAGRTGPRFDSYLLALEAAINGQGVAMATDFVVANDLLTGRLVKPFALEVPQPGAWYLVCLKERRAEPTIARFRHWLNGQIAADPNIRGHDPANT